MLLSVNGSMEAFQHTTFDPMALVQFQNPTPRYLVLWALLVPMGLLLACDSGSDMEVENISGQWSGTVERDGTEYTVVLTLEQLQGGQTSNVVQGEGNVESDEQSFAFTIENGSFFPASNEVTLPQQYATGRPGQIQGMVGEDLETITATTSGGPAGFDGEQFTLNKLD